MTPLPKRTPRRRSTCCNANRPPALHRPIPQPSHWRGASPRGRTLGRGLSCVPGRWTPAGTRSSGSPRLRLRRGTARRLAWPRRVHRRGRDAPMRRGLRVVRRRDTQMIPATLQAAADALISAREKSGATEAVVEAALPPGEVRIAGRRLTNMASNDYLGFARDPGLPPRARAALDEWAWRLSGTRAENHEPSPRARAAPLRVGRLLNARRRRHQAGQLPRSMPRATNGRSSAGTPDKPSWEA